MTGAFLDRNPKEVPGYVLGTTHADAHAAGPRQAQARLRLHADAARLVHARLVAQRRRPRRRLVPARRRRRRVTSGPTPVAGQHRRPQLHRPADRLRAHRRRRWSTSSTASSSRATRAATWDWEAAASLYDFARDIVRAQMPNAGQRRGAGRITDQHGTGWNTLALKGIWRPRRPRRRARRRVRRAARRLQAARRCVSDTPDWSGGEAAARFSAFAGRTSLTSLWAQDAWRFAPDWRRVLGARASSTGAPTTARLSNATTTLGVRAAQRDRTSRPRRRSPGRRATPGCCEPRSAAPCACRP